ncbi:MAG: type VI secretion system-associated protein TagF [Pseudomonadota bacterium]
MSSATAPGFYGKVPGLGDFVSRRLPRTFIDYWDSWLQSVIATSRMQLGEHWLNTYLSSPLWRFVLSSGHCGAQPWAGVLMPSVDRVGRYFPLTIAASLPAGTNPFATAAAATQWFEEAEALALSALEADGFDMEDFDASVQGLGSPSNDEANAGAALPDPAARAGLQVSLAQASQVSEGFAGVLQQLMADGGGSFSVWSTEGSDLVEPGLLVSAGLPGEHACTALLDGQWSQWSWGVLPRAGTAGAATVAPAPEEF